MGRRWGKDLERMVLEIYRDELSKLGISPEKVKSFTYTDVEGRYGPRGLVYEFDIVVEDDGVIVMEVKSRAEREDIDWFYHKVHVVRDLLGKIKRMVIIAVNIDRDALERTKQLGIDAIYGSIID